MDRLRLVETPDYSGYTDLNLIDCMTEEEEKNFSQWFNGQTGAIHDGHLLVYKHDLDRWLAGLQPID